ncbi:MAG: dTMP kinase [Filifactoraceae bacterium]
MGYHLITIEGTDGSGKQTQSELLYRGLCDLGYNCRLISFPDYESRSSELVKLYLAGEFGEISEVSGFAASMLYAADRFASFRRKWRKDYEDGCIIIADRYVSSNLIHQAVRMDSELEKEEFAKWIYDIEYVKFGIPRPNLEIFLDMPSKNAKELILNRGNKITGSLEKDILERDEDHSVKAYKNARGLCQKLGWKSIECVSNEKIKSIEEIHSLVLDVVLEYINEEYE